LLKFSNLPVTLHWLCPIACQPITVGHYGQAAALVANERMAGWQLMTTTRQPLSMNSPRTTWNQTRPSVMIQFCFAGLCGDQAVSNSSHQCAKRTSVQQGWYGCRTPTCEHVSRHGPADHVSE